MKEKENLESDVLRFFRDIENQTDSDKIQTLRLLMDKYIHISKSDYLMDKSDYNSIMGLAKKNIVDITLPVKLGKAESPISETEVANLCVIESVIGHLNKNGCLKKLPKFDYKK